MPPARSIVHVLSSFGVGGQERVALDLAIGQLERGHRVAVISLAPPPDGPLAAEFRDAGVAVLTVPKRRGGIDATLVPRLAWRLRRLGADVVHTHNPQPLIYGAPAARLVGAVAIHTKHGMNPGSRGNLLLRRAAARAVSAFVAVSEVTAAQAHEQQDCPPDKLVVIPNGIRLERFHPDAEARAAIRAELGIPADAWVVGTVGRVDEFKNQVLLVAAIAPMLAEDHRLVIVGDGPARATLEAAVAALPEPRWVHVLGRRMDVVRLMPSFDVFAMSSQTEGLPLVLPEAMAAGLPVVSTAVGGIPAVIEAGVTGLLCPVDEAALRERLRALASDHDRARAMGARARDTALAQYSAARMLDDYLALYEQALAQR
ncbi:MAG: glycosyltransferase [Kofleriaceae bacterium]|nr:glycosyltransferase [Myxococcales bacterium]MCB9574081.1 glycosyltransferase [Kofleriaceae bacterium]